jgi:hypothetical protein
VASTEQSLPGFDGRGIDTAFHVLPVADLVNSELRDPWSQYHDQ